ncbi:MAG: hypothetical protein AzoDbin1_05157 [Azoarcus sp.]|nr:hypothetical protein [Azoarcus sp.]
MPHAELSPSSAHRWIACPGSVSACRGLPDSGSEFAREGTLAHALAALSLDTGRDALDFLGRLLEDGDVTGTAQAEMCEYVQMYVQHVRNLRPDALLVETSVPIGHLTGEDGAVGTADALALVGDTLHVIDLKYGRGVRVDAEENEQLGMYALGAMHLLGDLVHIKRVVLTIVQPRLDHISEWEAPLNWLETLHSCIIDAAEEAARETAVRTPGESQCKFCRAKANCRALSEYAVGAVLDDFADLDAPTLPDRIARATSRDIDSASLAPLLALLPVIEDWCSAIRARALAEAEAGSPPPGWKLVQGRCGPRKWRKDALDDLVNTLLAAGVSTADIYDMSLKTPTTLLKIKGLADVDLSQFIERSPGKPTLVRENDGREGVGSTADEFEVQT